MRCFFAEPSLGSPASGRMSSSPKSSLGVFASMETAHSPNIKFKASGDPHLLNQTSTLCAEAPGLLVSKARCRKL